MKGWKKSLLIGFVIALTSEFYLSFFVSNFRISPSVVIFPILLMTIGIEVPVIPNAVVTSCLIFVSRLAVQLFSGVSAKTAVITVLPATFFYTTYGIMFRFMVRDRYGATIPRVTVSAFFCDFLSNIIELQLQEYFQNVPMTMDNALKLLAIAGIRSGLVCGFLMLIRWYRTILTLKEHEKRYQRMYLLTTSLKGEIYLMRQNTGQIERVMGNAYRLYEELLARDMPQEMQQMGLDIAREVHEIKKNYLRIIQGIEEELGREPEDEDIWLTELIRIMLDTARTTITEKQLQVVVQAEVGADFAVREHYSLMSILMNLVNNAIEAIEADQKKGTIQVTEFEKDGRYCFTVKDDGPGISERHLKNIFKMGYSTKFDSRTGNIFRGVGLCGVKNLVEEILGGEIRVESEPGKGTVFYVEIPCSSLEDTAAEGAAETENREETDD